MRLVECPTCSRQVDIKADPCPGCGRPDPSGKKGRAKRASQLFALFVLIIGGILFFKVVLPSLQAGLVR